MNVGPPTEDVDKNVGPPTVVATMRCKRGFGPVGTIGTLKYFLFNFNNPKSMNRISSKIKRCNQGFGN